MRSEIGTDEELRDLRIRCTECMVAWDSGLGGYQSGEEPRPFSRLQDEQECEICGRKAIGFGGLWAFREVQGDTEGEVRVDLYCL